MDDLRHRASRHAAGYGAAMIISTVTAAVLAAPAPVHSNSGGGSNAPLWLVVPFMVIVAGVLLVRYLRRR